MLRLIFQTFAVPAICTFILMAIAAASDRKRNLQWAKGVEVGMNISLLGAGACGAVFSDPVVNAFFGPDATGVGIAAALLCIAVVCGMAVLRRWQDPDDAVPKSKGLRNILIGSIGLMIPIGVIVLSYYRMAHPQHTNAGL